MFNVFLNDKRTEEAELRNSTELALEMRAKMMKQRNEVMSQKYRTRVGQFIKQVSLLASIAVMEYPLIL